MCKHVFNLLCVLLLGINLSYNYCETISYTIDWQKNVSRMPVSSRNKNIILDAIRDLPLKIVFINVNINNIRCRYEWSMGEITSEPGGNNSQVIYIPRIDVGMSTIWRCTAQSMLRSEVDFEVKVRGARQVAMSINGFRRQFELTQASPYLEGFALYEAEKDERIQIKLGNPNFSWTMHFEVFDDLGNKSIDYYHAMQLPFLLVYNMVMPRNNSVFLHCTLSNRPEYNQIFRYILVVMLKRANARPEEYIPPAIFTTTERYDSENNKNQTINSLPDTNNQEPQKILHKPPVILGLPNENTIHENITSDTWQVVYLYRINETVTLTCSTTEDYKLQWVIEKKDRIEFNIQNTKNLSRIFTFSAEDNGTSIICQPMFDKDSSNTQKAVILLHQKYDASSGLTVIIACVAGISAAAFAAGIVIFCCRRNCQATSKSGSENLVLEDIKTPEIPQLVDNCTNPYDYVYSNREDLRTNVCPRHGPHTSQQQNSNVNSDGLESHYYYEIDQYFIDKRNEALKLKNMRSKKM